MNNTGDTILVIQVTGHRKEELQRAIIFCSRYLKLCIRQILLQINLINATVNKEIASVINVMHF